jgi:hypothetical protein
MSTILRRAQHTKPVYSINYKSRNANKNVEKTEETPPRVDIYTKTQLHHIANAKTSKFSDTLPQYEIKPINDNGTFPTKVEKSRKDVILAKYVPFLKPFRKKQKIEYAPTTTQELNKQSEKTIFSDDEPVEMKTENLVKLDLKDPNLWHSQDAPIDLKQLPNYYLMLSKSRLTMLVCITSAAGHNVILEEFDNCFYNIFLKKVQQFFFVSLFKWLKIVLINA